MGITTKCELYCTRHAEDVLQIIRELASTISNVRLEKTEGIYRIDFGDSHFLFDEEYSPETAGKYFEILTKVFRLLPKYPEIFYAFAQEGPADWYPNVYPIRSGLSWITYYSARIAKYINTEKILNAEHKYREIFTHQIIVPPQPLIQKDKSGNLLILMGKSPDAGDWVTYSQLPLKDFADVNGIIEEIKIIKEEMKNDK